MCGNAIWLISFITLEGRLLSFVTVHSKGHRQPGKAMNSDCIVKIDEKMTSMNSHAGRDLSLEKLDLLIPLPLAKDSKAFS